MSVTLKEHPMSLAPLSEELPTQPSPEGSAREGLVSNRRIQANRKNALSSTGPKSKRGKEAAARNSLKHGLLAKSAVILLGPAKEDKAEFEGLLNALRDCGELVPAPIDLQITSDAGDLAKRSQ